MVQIGCTLTHSLARSHRLAVWLCHKFASTLCDSVCCTLKFCYCYWALFFLVSSVLVYENWSWSCSDPLLHRRHCSFTLDRSIKSPFGSAFGVLPGSPFFLSVKCKVAQWTHRQTVCTTADPRQTDRYHCQSIPFLFLSSSFFLCRFQRLDYRCRCRLLRRRRRAANRFEGGSSSVFIDWKLWRAEEWQWDEMKAI